MSGDAKDLRKCRYCPAMIRWGVTSPGGKPVPLDPKPIKVWIHVTEPARSDPNEPRLRLVSGWVSHHATCAGVDQARADVAAKRTAELMRGRGR